MSSIDALLSVRVVKKRKELLGYTQQEHVAAHFVKECVEFNHLWRANHELSHVSTILDRDNTLG